MRRSAEDPGILPRCAFPLTFPLRLIIFVGVGKEKQEERPAGRAGADLQSVTHTHTDRLTHVKKTWPNTANGPELFKQWEGEGRRRWRRRGDGDGSSEW